MNDAKTELGLKILQLKKEKKLSWAEIAGAIGYSTMWTCAASLGQMSFPPEAAGKLAELLDLSTQEQSILQDVPYRGSLPTVPPTDPLIYRFYELVSVYGTSFKQVIEEEFGDGIMSAIDFNMSVEREPNPAGDRVRIVMSGKFLPYKRY